MYEYEFLGKAKRIPKGWYIEEGYVHEDVQPYDVLHRDGETIVIKKILARTELGILVEYAAR